MTVPFSIFHHDWDASTRLLMSGSNLTYTITRMQTKMHQCLHIPEIIQLVFSFFDRSWVGNRALARLAQTCTFFYGPAVKALWRDLPGFVPILKLLPQHWVKFNRETGIYVRPQSELAGS
jgi:hypothetical protein